MYNDLKNLTEYEAKKHYYIYGCYEQRLYNNKIKIIIVCDDWDDKTSKIATGGNTALYNLGRLINEKKTNIYAKMYPFGRSNILNPYCNNFANDNEINDNTIVLYPDGNEYNPLMAKHVIRWILLELGILRPIDFYKTWKLSDLVYHWENSINNNKIKILNTTIINPLFVNNNNDNKKGSCYIIKKRNFGINNKIINVHPSNSICIDNIQIVDVVDIFNKCKYFYCYDLKTFLYIGAILCNCKVILIPDTQTKNEYIKNSIFRNFEDISKFFAWGIDDIPNINFNSDDINNMKQYISDLSLSVNKFLDDINSYFNEKIKKSPTVNEIYYN